MNLGNPVFGKHKYCILEAWALSLLQKSIGRRFLRRNIIELWNAATPSSQAKANKELNAQDCSVMNA